MQNGAIKTGEIGGFYFHWNKVYLFVLYFFDFLYFANLQIPDKTVFLHPKNMQVWQCEETILRYSFFSEEIKAPQKRGSSHLYVPKECAIGKGRKRMELNQTD